MDRLVNDVRTTTEDFYCMLNRTPHFLEDKSVFRNSTCGTTFPTRSRFKDDIRARFPDRQPTCALVSKSRDFARLAEDYSFQEEIDRHDLIVRFNLAKVLDGRYGCSTSYRILN